MKTMNSFIRKLSLVLTLILAIVSCKDEHDTLYSPDNSSSVKDVTLLFNVSDAAMPGSREGSGGSDFENTYLDDLWMIVFKIDNREGAGDMMRYYISRKVEEVKDSKQDGNATVTLPSELFKEDFKMLFLANSSSLWNNNNGIQNPDEIFLEPKGTKPYDIGKTLEDCRKILTLGLDENKMKSDNKGLYHQFTEKKINLPMYSEMDWKGDGSYPMTPLKIGSTKLLRSTARLDVGVNYSGTEIGATAQGFEHFKMTNVWVANTHSQFSVNPFTVDIVKPDPITRVEEAHATYNSDNSPTPWTVNKVSVPENNRIAEYIKAYVTGDLASAKASEKLFNSIEGRIFLPEEKVAEDKTLSEPNTEKPYIIVEGYYGVDMIKEAETNPKNAVKSYYRLDFVMNPQIGDFFDIKRGDLIRMNISSVTGPGYHSPEEAANSTGKNITVDISRYNIMNANSAFDGQSYLSVERLDIEMPRDAGVFFKLLTDFGGDIKWEDIQLGYKDGDREVFPTEEDGGITIGGLFKVKKETKAQSGDNHNDFNHWIRITNAKAWEESATPQTMLIRARNLTLQVSLEQKDISIYDWELGNEENLPLEGLEISSKVLYFEGAGNAQNLTVTPSTAENTSIKFYKKKADGEPDLDQEITDWLTAEEPTISGSNVVNIKISAAPNLASDIRTAIGVLQYGDGQTNKSANIEINQGQLTTADILSSGYGVKWLDRNAGAKGFNSEDQENTANYASINDAKLACPYGWVLPDITDFQNLVKEGANEGSFDTGIGFAKMPDNMLMMYTGYEKAYIPIGKYWLKDGSLANITLNGSHTDNQKLKPSDILISQESSVGEGKHYVRCVRKFSLEENNVSLEMTGDPKYINFSTLNTSDQISVNKIESGSQDSEIKVERVAGTNILKISSSQPNWTNNDINIKVKLKMDDGSEESKNYQFIDIKMSKKLPASDENNRVVIGNLMWDFRNCGATITKSQDIGILMKGRKEDKDPGRVMLYTQSVNNNTQFGDEHCLFYEGYKGQIQGGDIYGNQFFPHDRPYYKDRFGWTSDDKSKCSEIGPGWRLPTASEWIDLIENHIHVYKQKYASSYHIVNYFPEHNKKEYPVYYITDGKTITYFNMGLSASRIDGGGFNQSHGYYLSNDGSGGTNSYVIGFNRFMYDPDTGQPFPWLNKSVVSASEFHRYMFVLTSTSRSVHHMIRCVKTVSEGKK